MWKGSAHALAIQARYPATQGMGTEGKEHQHLSMRGRQPEPVAAPGVAEPVELNPITWRPAARSLSPPQATKTAWLHTSAERFRFSIGSSAMDETAYQSLHASLCYCRQASFQAALPC